MSDLLDVHITYDFVCPWCWIGHHHLRAALAQTGMGDQVSLHFHPFELNPGLPPEGIARRDYRTRKFGSWERSLALDAQVAQAGEKAGAVFAFDKMEVTPNSRLAHRLIRFAESQGDAARKVHLHDAIYAAYFQQGRNIGSPDVLVDIAEQQGCDAAEVRAFLASNEGEAEVMAEETQAHQDGIDAVPHFRVGWNDVSGAQPPAVLAQLLMAGR
jgi:predicted DsbA family dithiol-disulfide isomerase